MGATASPEVLANMHVFVTPADNETEETHHRIAWTKRVDARTILIQTVSGDIFAVGPKSYLQIGNSTEKQALSMAKVHRRLMNRNDPMAEISRNSQSDSKQQ